MNDKNKFTFANLSIQHLLLVVEIAWSINYIAQILLCFLAVPSCHKTPGSNMGANRLIQQKRPTSPYLVNLSAIVILLHVTTNSEVWGMLWFASEICIKGSCFE